MREERCSDAKKGRRETGREGGNEQGERKRNGGVGEAEGGLEGRCSEQADGRWVPSHEGSKEKDHHSFMHVDFSA